MTDELKLDSKNTTKPASVINPNKKASPLEFDVVMDLMRQYFNGRSRDQNKFYKDGNIHIVREEFDIVSFMKVINQMTESCIKSESNLTTLQAEQISEIFTAINSLTSLLKNQFDTSRVEYLFIIRLLSYCTTAYDKYNKSYARSRKIQKENDNA